MIHFELVTLGGTKFGDDVHEVIIPTPLGLIAVYQNHAPLVSLATPGVISVRKKAGDPDDFMEVYATNGGVIEVTGKSVRMLVDEADQGDEINEQEAKKALDEAHELRRKSKDLVSLSHAQSLIDRQTVRLKVAELKRHRRKR